MGKGHETLLDNIEVRCDQASSLDRSGELDQALAAFESILNEQPDYPRAMHARGVLLHKLERTQEALSALHACSEKHPSYLAPLDSLGKIYQNLYRYPEALNCYEKMIEINPKSYEAFFGMARVWHQEQQKEKALCLVLKSLHFNPGYVPALLGVIKIYHEFKQFDLAGRYCRRLLEIDPNNAEVWLLLGNLEVEKGDAAAAINCLRHTLCLKPTEISAAISINYYTNLLVNADQKGVFREARHFEQVFALPLYKLQIPHINYPVSDRKLRIGFVSADFKLHPVAQHIRPVVRHMNRTDFELYAYSNFNVHDAVTQEFKELFCHWRDVHGLADEGLADMIRADAIDILFDLGGFTGYSRVLLFARRPAPVQVSWIGYFNTTGMRAIDYLIADQTMVREGEERWFAEQVVRMPQIRFCYDMRAGLLPRIKALPALKNKRITFGAFCKTNKLNDDVIKTWSTILKSVPGSVLILKWAAYKERSTINSIAKRFAEYGIPRTQLVFRQESVYINLLREYTRDVDIVLDTFPHSGGATSCDALSMGVPVITLSGKLPISRQTHGFLKVMGLEKELVAFSCEEYVVKAVRLAHDIPRLQRLRTNLREIMIQSPLCDEAGFTKDFEKLLRDIWGRWCQKHTVEGVLRARGVRLEDIVTIGMTLLEERRYEAASRYFARALKMAPDNDEILNSLGICLWEQGRLKDALRLFIRGYRINPANDDVCCNASGILHLLGRAREALRFANDGLTVNPVNEQLYYAKANSLLASQRFEEALEVVNQFDLRFSLTAKILVMRGNVHLARGEVKKAIAAYMAVCEISEGNTAAASNLQFAMNYDDDSSQKDIFEASLSLSKTFRTSCNPDVPLPENRIGSPLRVGLVSADFRRHPCGFLVFSFLQFHDREKLSITCYSNNSRRDEMTEMMIPLARRWRDVRYMNDAELCRQVQEDDIDILIDLSGHTDGNRLAMFAMRPCRIQATWLGYFNTTGLSCMDYFISDSFTTPESMQQWFTEKIVLLPNSRFCYAPPAYSPLVSLAPAEWKGYVTFGAYNNYAKVSDSTVRMWAAVLKQVPRSRLVMKWISYRDGVLREAIHERFAREGVARHRVILRFDTHHSQMLADYSDLDIVLDTSPFNGGMSSLEALWMGVPIVTLAGSTPAGRQTGSFLAQLDLHQLIADTEEAYINAAVSLARDVDALCEIRSGLRRRMMESPLMDGKTFSRNMEKLLADIAGR